MADIRPKLFDVSRYQGFIRPAEMVAAGAVGIGIRGGISWGYQDPMFPHSWNVCRGLLFRMAYFVLYPDQTVRAQVDNWMRILGNDIGDGPVILDAELTRNSARNQITTSIVETGRLLRTRTGRKPILYSRTGWIQAYTNPGSWRNEFDWWLAQYLWSRPYPMFTPEHPGPVAPLPAGVPKALFHQTGDHCKGVGIGAGRYLDHDRFQGNWEVWSGGFS